MKTKYLFLMAGLGFICLSFVIAAFGYPYLSTYPAIVGVIASSLYILMVLVDRAEQ